MQDYQDPTTAIKYLDFLNSTNGQIQQSVLKEAILGRLDKNKQLKILDVASGPGWLSGELRKLNYDVSACDSSEFLIQFAKANYLGIEFRIADVSQALPYSPSSFDVVILNMAAPDIEKLDVAFKNLSTVLKSSGKFLMTIPNPKFSYPAAEWKRSLFDVLLGRKPKLQLKTTPLGGSKIVRQFNKDKISSYYYTLENYLSAAGSAGLTFVDKFDLRSKTDSSDFDLNYQLFRYPLILLLEFSK